MAPAPFQGLPAPLGAVGCPWGLWNGSSSTPGLQQHPGVTLSLLHPWVHPECILRSSPWNAEAAELSLGSKCSFSLCFPEGMARAVPSPAAQHLQQQQGLEGGREDPRSARGRRLGLQGHEDSRLHFFGITQGSPALPIPGPLPAGWALPPSRPFASLAVPTGWAEGPGVAVQEQEIISHGWERFSHPSGTKVSSRGAKMIPFTCRTGREFPENLAGEQSRAPRQERTPK